MEQIQISLAAARVNAGLSQRDVGEAIHVSTQTICNWESGKTAPTLKQAKALSELYNLPLNFLRL